MCGINATLSKTETSCKIHLIVANLKKLETADAVYLCKHNCSHSLRYTVGVIVSHACKAPLHTCIFIFIHTRIQTVLGADTQPLAFSTLA